MVADQLKITAFSLFVLGGNVKMVIEGLSELWGTPSTTLLAR